MVLFAELFRTIGDLFKGRGLRIDATPERRMGFMILAATLPTGLIGVLFNDVFEGFYGSLTAIGAGLVITGILLWIAERMARGRTEIGKMKFRHAFLIGTMQGIAIAPGISRSGSTLFGGLFCGLERNFALKFAFLVSIPAILGSVVLELPPALEAGVDAALAGPILAGTAVSAVMGFVAIKAMLRLVARLKLHVFSYYTWALGLFVLVYAAFFN